MTAILHAGLPEAFWFFRNATSTKLPPATFPRPLRFLGMRPEPEGSSLQWRYLRAGWHLATVDAAVTSVLLILAAVGAVSEDATIAAVTAVRYGAYAVLWLGLVSARHGDALRSPQWIVLLVIAALAGWGAAVA